MSYRRRGYGPQHSSSDFHVLKATLGQHAKQLATTVYDELRVKSNGRPVELILGIKLSGESELLVTQLEQEYFQRCRPKIRFHRVYRDDYESLSPIYFDSAEALKKKLVKIGKEYDKYKNSTIQDGIYISQYECGRLYRMVIENSRDCERFGITNAARSQVLAARVKSLAFTRWSLINPRNPKAIEVLDIGISEADTNTISPIRSATRRFKNSQNMLMRPKDFEEGVNSGTEEIIDRDAIRDRLKEFTTLSAEDSSPIILLVHHEGNTRQVLSDFGIDTSSWVSGIRELFYPPRQRPNPKPRVYVLDVKKIYEKLYQTPNGAESVKQIANSTSITTPRTPKEEWNAGNDAKYLVDIWSKMTKGLSIYEQFDLEQQARSAVAAPAPHTVPQDGDDDDDCDPNMIQTTKQTHVLDDYDDAPSDDE